jgi:curved DNA-binding protein CbpA
MSSSVGDATKNLLQKPPPSDALMQLWSPDGYYTYLGVSKRVGTADDNSVEKDAIKKNYRKLSLKHHPDRSGGDAETFRVLNRAQKVLTNPKLRQQYDILGLDLDDDEDEHHPHTSDADAGKEGDGAGAGGSDESSSTASQGIVNEMAQMALTAVMQMGVRTSKYRPWANFGKKYA